MTFRFEPEMCRDLEISRDREWLLANGIGGYSMGTISGINTRRYHGLLVAATIPPAERTLLLAGIEASVQSSGEAIYISTNEYSGAVYPEGYLLIDSFEVGRTAARWRYSVQDMRIERTIQAHQGENAVTLRYTNVGERPVLLTLRPLTACRTYHGNFLESPGYPERMQFPPDETIVLHRGIELHLAHGEGRRLPVEGWYYRFEHRRESVRGLDPRDDLFCPCELRYELEPGKSAVLVASEGSRRQPLAPLPGWENSSDEGGTLERFKEQAQTFLIRGDARSTILAGYPWFTDWGRDAMISLPGLCLATGQVSFARDTLRSYAGCLRDGLIPNRFLEKGGADYNTCDATLWFAHAAYETLLAEWDEVFAKEMLTVLRSIADHHFRGTLFGIGMDSADGLLRQGVPGQQLTWMDVKIGSWVVTPRHGKPVEVNGLWINLLRVLEWLCERLGEDGKRYADAATKAEKSFERLYWVESRGHYFDTVGPEDASLRPNQLIAMGLPFGPARGKNAVRALETIERELLTPVGLRTLGPSEPGYIGRYEGPLNQLDAAYHQGTVWPWLLGPYVDAVLRLTGHRDRAMRAVAEAGRMLNEFGIGGIAEVYDGDPPHRPNGCPWQAWSLAEVLRVLEKVETN